MDKLEDDSAGAKAARVDPAFWILFCDVWRGMEPDLAMPRERIFKNSKFAQIVAKTIQENVTECSIQLLDEVAAAVSLVSTTLTVQLTPEGALDLTSHYLQLLSSFEQQDLPIAHIEGVSRWTDMVFKILELSSFGIQDMQKMCRVFGAQLPHVIYLLSCDTNDKVVDLIHALVERFLFDPKNFPVTGIFALANIEEIKTTKSTLPAYRRLFRWAAAEAEVNPAAKETLALPLFHTLIKKSTANAIALLEECHDLGYKLSHKSLHDILTEALPDVYVAAAGVTKRDIHWKLVAALLKLDPTTAATSTVSPRLFKWLATAPEDQDTVNVMVGIAEGFGMKNMLSEFLTWWVTEMASTAQWRRAEVCAAVTARAKKLTSHQFMDLLKELLSKLKESYTENVMVATLSIVQALLFLTPIYASTAVKQLEKLVNLKSGDFDEVILWKMRYTIFTVAPLTPHAIKFKSIEPEDKLWKYQFGCLCRLREFSEVKDFDKALDKLLKALSKDLMNDMIPFLFNRWLVILDLFAKEKRLDKIGEAAASSFGPELVQNTQLFECSKVWSSVLAHLEDPVVLAQVPFEAYPKDKRVSLVNKFSVNPTEDGLNLVSKLVTADGAGGSNIENDVDAFCTLLDHGTPLSTELCSIVLGNHVRSKTEDVNKEFMSTLEKGIKKGLKKNKSISHAILYARVAASAESDFIQTIRETLTDVLLKADHQLMQTILNDTESLVKIFPEAGEVTVRLATVAAELISAGEVASPLLTSIACFLMGTSKPDLAITALFLSVDNSNKLVAKWYSQYLKQLSPEELSATLVSVVNYGAPAYHAFDAIIRTLSYDKHREADIPAVIVSAISLYLQGEQSLLFVTALGSLLREASWAVSQYALELILVVVAQSEATPETFTALTEVLTQILLRQRHRVDGRYVLIVYSIKALLRVLIKGTSVSIDAVRSLTRVIQLVCEPPAHSVAKSRGATSLTSAIHATRQLVSRHVIYLLALYAHLSVTSKFDAEVTAALKPAITSVFEVISEDDLNIANSVMDMPSRSLTKVLYSDFKRKGRWTDDM